MNAISKMHGQCVHETPPVSWNIKALNLSIWVLWLKWQKRKNIDVWMFRCHIVFEYFWNFNRELGGGWKEIDIKRGILQQILVLLPYGSFLYLVYINVAILCLYTVLFCYQQTLEKKGYLKMIHCILKGVLSCFCCLALLICPVTVPQMLPWHTTGLI